MPLRFSEFKPETSSNTIHKMIYRPEAALTDKRLSAHTLASFMELQNLNDPADIAADVEMPAKLLRPLLRKSAIAYWTRSDHGWLKIDAFKTHFVLTLDGLRVVKDRLANRAGKESVSAKEVIEALAIIKGLVRTEPLEAIDPDRNQAVYESAGGSRSNKLSAAQYIAACEIATLIYQTKLSRKAGMAQLATEHQVTQNSASALINNYRCLMTGTPIKAPMSADAMEHFTDCIVAMHGAIALQNVVLALGAFVTYVKERGASGSPGMQRILECLQRELGDHEKNRWLADAFRNAEAGAKEASNEQASEILREIWMRGPQHAAFRRSLKRRWNNVCAVHGVPCNGQLRASHIVAWRLDEAIRGDVDNGLLLSAPLDSLFDRGLISFASNGEMLFSIQLAEITMTHFGLRPGLQLGWLHLSKLARSRIETNLARHRALYAPQHGYA